MSVAVQIFIITKRTILAIVVAIVAIIVAGILLFAYWGDPLEAFSVAAMPEVETYELDVSAAARREVPIYGVDRSDNKIALTIDAAWGSDKTTEILQILNEKEVKATWFLCGYWIDKYADKVKEIAKQGHEIGNHTATHPHMTKLSDAQMQEELQKVEADINKLTNVKTTLFRAPFGEYDDRILKNVRSMGYEAIQWSVSTDDWKEGRNPQDVLNQALKQLHSGAIILTHNNAETICDYLPKLIDECRAQGYEFVTVSELLLEGEYTVDNNGIQKKAE